MQPSYDNAPAMALEQVIDVVGRSTKVQDAQPVHRMQSCDRITKTD